MSSEKQSIANRAGSRIYKIYSLRSLFNFEMQGDSEKDVCDDRIQKLRKKNGEDICFIDTSTFCNKSGNRVEKSESNIYVSRVL